MNTSRASSPRGDFVRNPWPEQHRQRNQDGHGGGGGGILDWPRAKPNHILLFTVHNARHPITAQVMGQVNQHCHGFRAWNATVLFQVCSGLAPVQRAVVIRKRHEGDNVVKALVEFATVGEAQWVKDHLQVWSHLFCGLENGISNVFL